MGKGTISPALRKALNDGSLRQQRIAVTVPRQVHAQEHGLFFSLLRRDGLPLPVTEWAFAKDIGRRWRFDFAWPDEWESHGEYAGNMHGPLVALEVEGGAWTRGRHTRGSGFVKDLEKYNEASCRGWRLIRVTPSQLCTLETIHLIKRALNA